MNLDSEGGLYLDCKELVLNVSTRANQKFHEGELDWRPPDVLSSLNYPVILHTGLNAGRSTFF